MNPDPMWGTESIPMNLYKQSEVLHDPVADFYQSVCARDESQIQKTEHATNLAKTWDETWYCTSILGHVT